MKRGKCMALNNEENLNIYRKCRKELDLTRNEASELLECFQWSNTEYELKYVKEEKLNP